MKLLLFVLCSLIATSTYAGSCDSDVSKCPSGPEKTKICNDAAAQIQLNCGAKSNSCKYLHGCLERRDTCVSGLSQSGNSTAGAWVPNSKPKCDSLKSCLSKNKENFKNPYGECNYNWQPKGPAGESGSCSIYYNMFAYQYTCPGRRDYFDEKKGDKTFNCQDVVTNYNEFEKTCKDLKTKYAGCKRFSKYKAALSDHPDNSCKYAADFKERPSKTYAVKGDEDSWMDTTFSGLKRFVGNWTSKDEPTLGPVSGANATGRSE
ncbi:MAG: hypothetical protein HN509_17560 [Halobacteriovoraceae bacterium]|jgi:hypothetical protein|nr:hypothetical protein [Halobacteriovoraceae bacterium]MBT5092890.1 hypothetical protein [Halobacteriovoraceae bacterium]